MSATSQPAGATPSRTPSEYSVRKQLDALAAGEIDNTTFLRDTLQRFRLDSEESWEVLALLDQYHRLGKIKSDAFREIKTKIGEYALRPRPAPGAAPKPAAPEPPRTTPTLTQAAIVKATLAAREPATREPATREPATREPAARESTPRESAVAKDSSAKQAGVISGAPAEESAREVRVGDVLRRRYRIEAVLSSGGMGAVFEASDPLRLDIPPCGQRLAIKVLHSAITEKMELLQELRREFQDLQSLSHPNIVRVYEFDRDGPAAFFTMELLEGISLSRLLGARQRRPLPRPLALGVIRDLTAAIGYAHSRGIVHGDINPQNIFITTRGELRVLGFGKAQRVGVSPINPADEPVMTSLAAPEFASCQVLESDRPSAQDDLFSLACLAYLLLSGEHPYRDCSAIEARAMRMRPRRPPWLWQRQWYALRAGLQFDRKQRPADIQAWIRQLDVRSAAAPLPAVAEMLEAAPAVPRRFALLTGAAAILVALGAGYWLATENGWLPSLLDEGTPRVEAPLPKRADAPVTSAAPSDSATRPASVPLIAPKSSRPAPPPAAPPAVAPSPAPPPAAAPTHTAAAHVATPATASTTGPAKLEMLSDTEDALPGERAAHVTVRRKGNVRGETSFNWWTESGTAKPGTDFAPITPRLERMEDGQLSVTLNIPLSSIPRAQPKSFYVIIDEAEGGAKLNGRRLTMVTLPATN
jgi:serine/threonine protein kinase